MARRALITGIAGQDGTYLTELLLSHDYDVYGIIGPYAGSFHEWAEPYGDRIRTVDADLTHMESLLAAVEASDPDEIYNFSAVSSVGESWSDALAMTEVNAVGVLRMLEAIRRVKPEVRFFQASSAEMFGNAPEMPQRETTPLHPISPYAAAKTYGYHIVNSYRDSYGMHASNGILFNHESPRRGLQFVTRKITDGAVRIKLGLATDLHLGNLDARRDWGFAGDYVRAMWLMLQQERADDYVVGTGQTHSVQELCEVAFSYVGLNWRDHVVQDARFVRPAEVDLLVADPGKANQVLQWQPRVAFEELVHLMVDSDLALVRQEQRG